MCPVCAQEGDEGWESIEDSHIDAAHGDVDVADADIIDMDDDSVVQIAKALPEPIQPSKQIVEAHNLTHWPYRSWCPHCVAARKANSPRHRSSSLRRRTVPLLVADYCFVRDNEDAKLAKVLVCKIEPANLMLCTVVDEKGNDEATVLRLTNFIRDSGYKHLVYKSDQEPAIRAMFEAAAKTVGREIN